MAVCLSARYRDEESAVLAVRLANLTQRKRKSQVTAAPSHRVSITTGGRVGIPGLQKKFHRMKAEICRIRLLGQSAMSLKASFPAAAGVWGILRYVNYSAPGQYEQIRDRSPSLQYSASSETVPTADMNDDSSSSTTEHVHSPDEQASSRRLNRKMDVALLPFLSLLYLLNGLDRSNIGNAETQGRQKTGVRRATTSANVDVGFSRDIGATPDDLNLAVSLFFVPFVLLQPASAAVGRWFGARHWITVMMVSSFRDADVNRRWVYQL